MSHAIVHAIGMARTDDGTAQGSVDALPARPRPRWEDSTALEPFPEESRCDVTEEPFLRVCWNRSASLQVGVGSLHRSRAVHVVGQFLVPCGCSTAILTACTHGREPATMELLVLSTPCSITCR